MRTYVLAITWGGWLIAGLLAPSVSLGQTQEPVTITVRTLEPVEGAKPALEIEYENKSGKVIAAYAVRIDDYDKNGKLISRQSVATITKDLGMRKGRPGFQPGERWLERIPIQGQADSRDVAMDVVVYADGTHWGPNRTGRLQYFRGFQDGARMERIP
jgi:hypothetical protein